MRDGILTAIRARLAENGKLAANGGRRTGGVLNSMSKVVYSTCNLCKQHPERPPLWQIRATSATEDAEHKRIEYTDAEMQMFGVPVAYFPYFWTAEPSSKRTSGLLVPSFGISSHIGGFFAQPYYWVIDDQSDATITPMLTTNAGPEIDLEIPPPLQFRLYQSQRFGRIFRAFAAGHHLCQRHIRPQRHLAGGL